MIKEEFVNQDIIEIVRKSWLMPGTDISHILGTGNYLSVSHIHDDVLRFRFIDKSKPEFSDDRVQGMDVKYPYIEHTKPAEWKDTGDIFRSFNYQFVPASTSREPDFIEVYKIIDKVVKMFKHV